MKFSVLLLTVFLLKVASSVPASSDISGKAVHHAGLKTITSHAKPVGIFGGHNITINQANFVGAILGPDSNLLGTAVILNNRWIVTAAFNFYALTASDVKIRFGSKYTSKGGNLATVHTLISHPQYTGQWDYDIALAKLNKPLKFSGVTQNVGLSSSLPKNHATATVTGFGWTEDSNGGFLQQASLPYINYETCKPSYPKPDFTKYSFCTSKDNVGPCAYDFGSPLVYNKKVVGLYSGTYACGSTTYPGVYADTTKFNQWIRETIKKNSDSEDEWLEDDDDDDDEDTVV